LKCLNIGISFEFLCFRRRTNLAAVFAINLSSFQSPAAALRFKGPARAPEKAAAEIAAKAAGQNPRSCTREMQLCRTGRGGARRGKQAERDFLNESWYLEACRTASGE